MKKNQDILALLQKEERLFREFYSVTSEMLICPEEELEPRMEERIRLQKEIETLEEEKEMLCAADEKLLAAAKCTGGCAQLPESYQEICKASRKLRGTLFQVNQLEPQVISRLEKTRDALEKKIRETNQGSAAKASRFLVGASVSGIRSGRIGKA